MLSFDIEKENGIQSTNITYNISCFVIKSNGIKLYVKIYNIGTKANNNNKCLLMLIDLKVRYNLYDVQPSKNSPI